MLRFQPPLTAKKEELDCVIEALDEACSKSSVALAIGAGRTALKDVASAEMKGCFMRCCLADSL